MQSNTLYYVFIIYASAKYGGKFAFEEDEPEELVVGFELFVVPE